MPAFTAIGIYVASAVTGAAFASVGAAVAAGAFTFAAVATVTTIGAAYITSRLINGNQNKEAASSATVSEGGRIQLPPATNHKIPVSYGETFINGVITDARITDENKTMYYCMVLGERTQTGTYTVEDIYSNDLRLVFEGAGSRHKVNKGVKTVDGPGEDFENSYVVDSTNLIEVRVYAGGSGSANQIFPVGDTLVNAYSYWDNGSGSWTSAHEMKGLVFAIVKVRYNADKGLTSVPNFTFKIKNTLDNPASVFRDYMTSVRYGAGVDGATIPTGAGTDHDLWLNYCDEQIRYTDKDSATALQRRYTINGVVDTNRSVKTNIDSILQSGGAWLSYDVVTGYWRPIIKQAETATFVASRTGTTLTVSAFTEGRIAAGMTIYNTAGASIGTIVSQNSPGAGESTGQIGVYVMDTSGVVSSQSMTAINNSKITLEFDDDNIIGGIAISSSNLEDLFNGYETEFFDRYNKDQRAYARASIASGERNPNEPENTLRLGLEFVNNSVQADILSNIELRQSRDDLVINFTAAHYGIQAQAGDIIKVTNAIYGWNPKYFRVMRVKEIEAEEGALIAQIEALEYNGDTYTIESITEFTTEANIGIIPFETTGTDTARIQTPEDDRVSVVEKNEIAAVPNIVMAVKIPTSGGPYDEIQVWYGVGSTSTAPTNNAYTLLQVHKPPPPAVIFDLGRTLNVSSITSNTVTSTAHGLSTGDQVYYFNSDSKGFLDNKIYYVKNAATDTFDVSLSQDGATVTLTNGTTSITGTSITGGNTINFSSAHGLSVNDEIIFTSATQLGLVQNTRYYVISTGFTTTSIRLSTTKSTVTAVTLTNGTGLSLAFNRLLLDTCHAITISGLPANAAGQKYYFKVRVCSRGVCSEFTDPDGAVISTPEVEFDPDSPAGSAYVQEIKTALLSIDFGYIIIPNNGYWFFRTIPPCDFGSLADLAGNYPMDLGLLSVTENTVDETTVIKDFVWQLDPT